MFTIFELAPLGLLEEEEEPEGLPWGDVGVGVLAAAAAGDVGEDEEGELDGRGAPAREQTCSAVASACARSLASQLCWKHTVV